MENQQKFLELIRNPWELNSGTLSFLERLTADYPYCQSLQILLAKNLQPFDKLDFEKQVNKASAYTIDRRKFQRYISDRDKPQAGTPVVADLDPLRGRDLPAFDTPQVQKQEPGSAVNSTSVPLPAPTEKEEKPEETVPNNPSQDLLLPTDTIDTTMAEAIETDSPQSPSSEDTTVSASHEVSEEQEDPLQTARLQAPESPTTQSLLDIVKRRLREIRDRNKPQSDREVPASTSSAVPEEPAKTEVEPTAPDAISPEVTAKQPTTGDIQKHSEKAEDTETDENLHLMRRPVKKPDINFLIDKFLKEEPRIQVRKDLPEEQEDLSAPSSEEDNQLITETLALVYLKQGRKDKALDVYEKLCLKFPEKSSYFAKKIIDINNEINS